ncbi:DDE-type integrase/transposase/recombinase [Segatella bryantii]|uniref:DDE-type integrase/transposase/recombinase n=1 Tax=Segatella bryantii TaxID=77095 RepID=UPI002853047F|nr:DDE-type integrase/transposase/recombinase [Segatella bryantii]MDR4931692.1 DDE-type integrase/transposase/recombinase [Segatella bryantii]
MKHKTRTERVYNEATGWYETREVELKGYTFTDDDRILIVREYLESGVAAEKIIKKYHISSRSVLFSWMDKFLNEKDSLPLQQEPVDDDDMAKTTEGVCYLSLITDLYSHKIVGWSVGPTLETTYPIEALNMAYKTIDDDTARSLIHHSDRGCQYCSQMYVTILKSRGTQISMTQSGDPLENAVA